MPDPADPRAVAGAAHPADAGARDRRLPPLRGDDGRRAAPDAALEGSIRVLRRRRFRVARDPERPALAAEKGVAREVGSLLFHWAFILLLVGVVYGKGTGFSGLVAGRRGADVDRRRRRTTTARSAPAGSSTATSPASACDCASSAATSGRTGQAMDFVSRVDLLEPGRLGAAPSRTSG